MQTCVGRCPTPICNCMLDYVWSDKYTRLAIYPRSHLVAWRGVSLRYLEPTHQLFGIHRLKKTYSVRVVTVQNEYSEYMFLAFYGDEIFSDWRIADTVEGVGAIARADAAALVS